jgi:hypothetical protein
MLTPRFRGPVPENPAKTAVLSGYESRRGGLSFNASRWANIEQSIDRHDSVICADVNVGRETAFHYEFGEVP